ncbi:MAG: polyribonucleotide nucleotidyltransferase [Chloroflexi bacterium]|nr:polyribonucleotide nucleotidyltransferase [Chloroflexota bacterium]
MKLATTRFKSVQKEIGGRTLSLESGKLAGQAGGAVTLRYGDTILLVTACMSDKQREGVDFLPLTVDYEGKLYAAGKIPGGFFRREGRPTTDAILAARLTDRPLRPLFPKSLRNDVQIVCTVLSADQENDPDILAIIGASAALGLSPIPFAGPVAATRVGYVNGELVVNPTYSELEESSLDLVVAGTRSAVVMVEAGALEVPESVMVRALEFGQQVNQTVLDLQEELANEVTKATPAPEPMDPELARAVSAAVAEKLPRLLGGVSRGERNEVPEDLLQDLLSQLGDRFPVGVVKATAEKELRRAVRQHILATGRRTDGRAYDEIRPISCELGLLPRTHGSGLFTRGETQVLAITTLAPPGMEQQIDDLTPEESKRFMHHYNFPPFSTGEAKRMLGPGRREIGHGALAERALEPLIPDETDFPYTIRIVSEVLSSNGSTSMASVCASSLSLMDAGVPMRAHVAGVAMGLLQEDGRTAVLTDIAGIEDAYGDMDFKVAGTERGVTALQLDIKALGLDLSVLDRAMEQAHEARMTILGIMDQAISSPRPQLSKYAPRIVKIQIKQEKIGAVIGPGGKTIRSIIEDTKATIDVESDGTVFIGSTSEEAAKRAIDRIMELTQDVEVGHVYTGKVTRLMRNGAFVEIFPGKEGLVPVSELAEGNVYRPEDVVSVGDEVTVVVTEIDRMGRVNLSRRALFQPAGAAGPPRAAPRPGFAPGPREGGDFPPRRPGFGGPPHRGPSPGGPPRPPFGGRHGPR